MNFNIYTIANKISQKIKNITFYNKDLYTSSKYCFSPHTWVHPITLSLVCESIKELYPQYFLAIDIKLNNNKKKFQPDIVVFKNSPDIKNIKLIIDYESLNSSDYRVVSKDIHKYINFFKNIKKPPYYLIITTLPTNGDNYKILYTAKNQYNHFLTEKDKKILKTNPFNFWKNIYKKELSNTNLPIFLLNINSNSCSVYIKS